ncbi:MAG: GntR family transcriptional regulator [Lachnospiraceae bacterium]|nr:GntR family transcriptional regulator [Lachnospiraceae bacterium]
MIKVEKLAGESTRDYASRFLCTNIISLELKPGQFLSETELAKEIGVSRTPLREALIDLNRSQVIETYPQRGSMVALIDPDLVEESRFIREVLDISVVEIACDMATPEDIMNLEANVKLQEFYLENYVTDKIFELDNEFHKMIYIIAHKERTYTMKAGMMIHYDRMRALSLITVKDTKIVNDHKLIFEAIKRKDKEEAKRLMKKHLSRYDIDKEEIKKAYPQYYKS